MTHCLKKSMSHRKLILGHGINDAGYLTNPTVGGKKVMCKYYRTWRSMIGRCYSIKCHAKQPTYIGCTVAPEWHSFVEFRSWMEHQDWQGKHLDKDLIQPGNKVYGPEACVFVPREINNLLTTTHAARGDLPLGVSRHGKGFRAYVGINGERQNLGTFTTPEEAHTAYITAKAAHIRHVAAEQSDSRLTAALIRHAGMYEQGEIK